MITALGGFATKNGFEINTYSDYHHDIKKFQTHGHREKSVKRAWLEKTIYMLAVVVSTVAFGALYRLGYAFWPAVPVVGGWEIAFMALGFTYFVAQTGMVFYALLFHPASANQWHACEHKLVHLLEKFEKPTLENIRNADSIHNGCASARYLGNILGLFFFLYVAPFLPLSVVALLGVANIGLTTQQIFSDLVGIRTMQNDAAGVLTGLFLFWLFFFVFLLFELYWIPVLLAVNLVIVLTLKSEIWKPFQKLFLAGPTDDQYRESLMLITEIYLWEYGDNFPDND